MLQRFWVRTFKEDGFKVIPAPTVRPLFKPVIGDRFFQNVAVLNRGELWTKAKLVS